MPWRHYSTFSTVWLCPVSSDDVVGRSWIFSRLDDYWRIYWIETDWFIAYRTVTRFPLKVIQKPDIRSQMPVDEMNWRLIGKLCDLREWNQAKNRAHTTTSTVQQLPSSVQGPMNSSLELPHSNDIPWSRSVISRGKTANVVSPYLSRQSFKCFARMFTRTAWWDLH